MTDIVSPEVRSRMMAGIRGKDTRPELLVRRYLHGRGFRYTLSNRKLPGKPDLVLPRHCAVVLVHGCYWHSHERCRFATRPATRPEFWAEKFAVNRARDVRVLSELEEAGWRVAIVWECALRREPAAALRRLESFLQSGRQLIEIGSPAQEAKQE